MSGNIQINNSFNPLDMDHDGNFDSNDMGLIGLFSEDEREPKKTTPKGGCFGCGCLTLPIVLVAVIVIIIIIVI
jgi:hypothetical protein